MSKAIRISILANGRGARAELDQTARSASKFGDAARKVGRAAVAGLAVAGAAAIKLGVDSVRSASDAQQSLGATETVFGKYADTVIRRSNEAADAVGLSANEYRELANVTGAMLANAGTPIRKVTELTDKLTRRASDMAATYGGTTKDAIESVNALLRGETDPIEKYGVSIKASDISARLAAKGLDKLEGSARKQAEQQERLSLLFEQTSKTAGQFGRESNTLAGQQQRLGAKFDNLKVKVGNALLPVLTDLTSWASSDLVPALDRGAEWFQKNSDEISEMGRTVGQTLLPPLKTAGQVLKTVGDVLASIPAPLREVAGQAGLAALAFPKITRTVSAATGSMSTGVARVRQFRAEMSYAETRSQRVSSALSSLRGAAGQAAGIGGMLLLVRSASRADTAMGKLEGTVGGALMGFAAGGPWGAAIGGGVGLIATLTAAARKNKDAFRSVTEAADSYQESLEGLSAQAGDATREMVYQELQQRGLLSVTRELGLSDRQAVQAMTQQGDARRALVGGVKSNVDALNEELAALREMDQATRITGGKDEQLQDKIIETQKRRDNYQAILNEVGGIDNAVAAERRRINATTDWRKQLEGLPQRAITRIETEGAPESIGQVRSLARQMRLTPRNVRTLVEVLGFSVTNRQMKNLMRQVRGFDKQKPRVRVNADTGKAEKNLRSTRRLLDWVTKARGSLNFFNRDLTSDTRKAEKRARGAGAFIKSYLEGSSRRTRANLSTYQRGLSGQVDATAKKAKTGSDKTRTNLESGPKNARANISGFSVGLLGQLNTLKGSASSGGRGVGSNMGSGIYSGLGGWLSSIVGRARSLVQSAISAARSAARINSPSKATMEIGGHMGEGLALGLERRSDRVRKAGDKFTKKLLKGITDGARGVAKVIDRIAALVRKRVEMKDAGKERAREREILKNLSERYKRLRRNAQAQDRVNRRLQQARERLKQLKQERKNYAAQVKAGVVEYGSVISVGQGDGFGSLQQMLDQMKERVKRSQEWAKMLEKLKKAGLNKTTLDQLAQAGVEGGFGTAQAILSGGKDAVSQINQMTGQLQAAGGAAGDTVAGAMYDAGIKAAQGLVNGLQKKAKELDRIANQIGRRIANAVRRALGIKSPSRVFAEIGKQTVLGLELGLDDTRARRAAGSLAGSLTDGFGQPALKAYLDPALGGRPVAGAQSVSVKLTAEQVNQLQRGRQIQLDLNAYKAATGATR